MLKLLSCALSAIGVIFILSSLFSIKKCTRILSLPSVNGETLICKDYGRFYRDVPVEYEFGGRRLRKTYRIPKSTCNLLNIASKAPIQLRVDPENPLNPSICGLEPRAAKGAWIGIGFLLASTFFIHI